MTFDAAVTMEVIRTGQPRPYADHENVYRVRFIARDRYTGIDRPGRYITNVEKFAETQARERLALAMCGADDLPRGKPADIWYSGTWVERVVWLDDGQVEIMTMATFFD